MQTKKRGKKVAVVGAGLGGLSAALSLAIEGFDVEVFEKNETIGGKLNLLKAEGYQFDLGPSILTLPKLFARIFERAGRRMEDYIPIRAVRPHWRNVFEDGSVIDLYPEPERMADEARKAGESPEAVQDFLAYAKRLYDLVDAGYFQQGLDTAAEFRAFYGLSTFPRFDLFHSMHGAVQRRLATPHFVDIFDFFIKYVGSSAYRAPAFMNCLPTIQFEHDLWYVMGGMYGIAEGFRKLMDELGVVVHTGVEVIRLNRAADGGSVAGLTLADGVDVACDYVVSNMEVIPAYERLLGMPDAFMKPLRRRLEPACSGLVIDLGLDCAYPQLAHHNFFFSGNQAEHFKSVFQKKELPRDPTLYVVAASKTDPSVAPAGCDGLKILPHIPYLLPERPVTDADYDALKERCLAKLERMGLEDLRKHVVFEHVWTPRDIQRQYYSNGGSIYGVVSDRFKNLAFKGPKASPAFRNLFFVGGSVNPGGGMPMVVLCGQNVARLMAARDDEG